MHFYVPSKLKLYSISAINKMATDWPRSGSKLILLLILYSSGVFFSFFFFFCPSPWSWFHEPHRRLGNFAGLE